MLHTSGLVLTLSDDPVAAEQAVSRIAEAGPFTISQHSGRLRAVVLEARGPDAAHEWHDWAAGLDGVEGVEVVFVHWDDAEVDDGVA